MLLSQYLHAKVYMGKENRNGFRLDSWDDLQSQNALLFYVALKLKLLYCYCSFFNGKIMSYSEYEVVGARNLILSPWIEFSTPSTPLQSSNTLSAPPTLCPPGHCKGTLFYIAIVVTNLEWKKWKGRKKKIQFSDSPFHHPLSVLEKRNWLIFQSHVYNRDNDECFHTDGCWCLMPSIKASTLWQHIDPKKDLHEPPWWGLPQRSTNPS